MSIQAMAWAIEQKVVKDSTARHVLLCLCNYADTNGESIFPSVHRLCENTGLSERSVRYKLDELEQLGVIERFGQKIADAKIGRPDRVPTAYRLRGAFYAPRQSTGCKPCTNGVQQVQKRGAPVAPNPFIDPSKNRLLSVEEEYEQRRKKSPVSIINNKGK